MPYTGTTWLALKQALLARLGDSVFYTDDTSVLSEMDVYLTEALRVWNIAAHRWKDRRTLTATSGTTWYDLSTLAPVSGPSLVPTVTDRRLLGEIEYHLLETLNLTGWSGTDMFTLADVTGAIERRLSQFLLETGENVRVDTVATGLVPASGRFEIPIQSSRPVIDVRRLTWIAPDGTYHHLWRDDEHAALSYLGSTWRDPSTPIAYSVLLTQPLQVQFIPPPNVPAQLEVLGVYAGATVDVTVGVTLTVPDDLAWVVKWGALADLLGREGQARDPRAQYCERRWREGVELGRIYSPVLAAAIANRPLHLSTLHSFDSFQPGWQNAMNTVPTDIALYRHLLALYPRPDGNYGLDLDVLRFAPVPATDATAVQLGPEEQDAILDYAHHVASFKQGGQEFASTVRQYDNLLRLAAVQNERLRASGVFARLLHDRGGQEETERLRRTTGRPLQV